MTRLLLDVLKTWNWWSRWEITAIEGVSVDNALATDGAGKKLVNTSLELATLA